MYSTEKYVEELLMRYFEQADLIAQQLHQRMKQICSKLLHKKEYLKIKLTIKFSVENKIMLFFQNTITKIIYQFNHPSFSSK